MAALERASCEHLIRYQHHVDGPLSFDFSCSCTEQPDARVGSALLKGAQLREQMGSESGLYCDTNLCGGLCLPRGWHIFLFIQKYRLVVVLAGNPQAGLRTGPGHSEVLTL